MRVLPFLARSAFWLAIVFTFVIAIIPQPPVVGASDKLQHFIAFLVLTALAATAYPKARLLWLALALAAFGALIELLQMTPVISRDGQLLDWVADTAGIAAAGLAIWLYRVNRDRERSSSPPVPPLEGDRGDRKG